MESHTELVYHLDLITSKEVAKEVDAVVAGLRTGDKDLQDQAKAAGLDLSKLDEALKKGGSAGSLIGVRPTKSGLDPAAVAIIVAFAPVAAKITRDIWDRLILPRIRRVHGRNSIKPAPGGDS